MFLQRGTGLFLSPVADDIGTGVVDFDDNENMLEVRADVLGSKGKGPGLLEYYGDYIIPDVPLS